MSAFIVKDRTINRVVTLLGHLLSREWMDLEEEFKSIGLRTSDQGFCEKLGQALFILNIEAVEKRYGKGEAVRFRDLRYKYVATFGERIQVYKSLRCLLYQCTEADVPERPLYKLMEKASCRLAAKIISELPEYDRAKWE